MKNYFTCLILSMIVAAPAATMAQTGAASARPEPSRAVVDPVPLRVQVVLSRYAGEKKVSSIPYTLSVVANDNDTSSLRMGVDVPVPVSVIGAGTPVPSYNYRSFGTKIDCSARSAAAGAFTLNLAVEDSSLFVPEKDGAATRGLLAGMPAFRSFTSTFNVVLKDGQTAQHTSATDAVSGEVLRIDVTLTVLK